ncbi:putative ArsR family transcriptional regulator [Metabacillus crassostreae]|uniref:helix-turn-helix transcriptional regulator n=1 Tax=Metabacillus crassostreae TaxID=929098 RepID=UPI00195938E3|nr:metalloregulator ArsR/SmtB family transcription factor [Metabacillus crassostreae]MBM7604288.1 putative ArsR family transcriptional regulator [Metabacillus crassostreae]
MTVAQKSTKDKILNLIKKEGSLTVNELTSHLNITHMAVRKHLGSLEKDGFILSSELKQPMGRPLQIYSLSQKAAEYFPKNYEGISVDFLNDIKELHGEETIDLLFKNREERLSTEYRTRMQHKHHSVEKLNEMVNIQNEKGYMAELLKIDNNTYELTEYNCPILSVAKEYKVACRCETAMFKEVIGTENINRTLCQTEGDRHCKFLIKIS